MREYRFKDEALVVEGVSLADVADKFGTPLYVYSKESIRDHCRHILSAFDGKDHLACYAAKANSNVEILRLIAAEGLGVDVGSSGELHLALKAGFTPEKITFSGVGKRDDELVLGLENDVRAFNVESVEEIDLLSHHAGTLGKKARVMLRVNLDIDAGGHAYVSTSLQHNKFGVSVRSAPVIMKHAMSLPNIELRGVHSHIGSQITEAGTFERTAKALVSLVADLRSDGIPLYNLDFGGGFGVQYKGYVQHPAIPFEEPETKNLSTTALIAGIVPILEQTGCALSFQPGRSVVAHAGVLLVRVLYRKETESKTFIIVDGGMNDLLRPSLYQSHHQIVPVQITNGGHEQVDVVGPLCESGDFLAQDRVLPVARRGDLLAVMCTGAYGYALASNYNARPRSAEILVDGETCAVIRERERIEEL